jgi:hypothetical protein
MRRRLFTLAAGVSAVLFVSVCVLWVRSYRVEDRLWYDTSPYTSPQRRWIVTLSYGRLYMTVDDAYAPALVDYRGSDPDPSENWGWKNTFGYAAPFDRWRFVPVHAGGPDQESVLGFGFRWARDPQFGRVHRLAGVPLYAAAALTAVLPVIWMRRWRRSRKDARRRCPACGYGRRKGVRSQTAD